MKIGIIIPTITGREEHLQRCRAAYIANTRSAFVTTVVRDHDRCGRAWREGAEILAGLGVDYLHFSADDLEPQPDWDTPAIEAVVVGHVPAPVILKPGGAIESVGGYWDRYLLDWQETDNTCVVPFCSIEQWARIGPPLDAHYYTDNYFTARAREEGYRAFVRTGYAFTHHWAAEGRGDESAKLERDKRIFEEAMA